MEFEELRKEHKIFAYHVSPSYGIEGDEGGFSIEIYGNGNLRYCTYKLFEEINTLEMFKLTKEQAYQVFKIMQEYEKKLENIPTYIEDGKEHKNCSEFEFLNCGKIYTGDVLKTFLPLERLKNREQYKIYKEAMKWNNLLYDIFEKVSACLKKAGIFLAFESCELSEDCKIRVTWK